MRQWGRLVNCGIADERCFIGGMTGVVTDIKNLCDEELPIYVVIAVLLSLLVLELTSTSYLTPLLFLFSIKGAILYNLEAMSFGRNFLYHKGADCDPAAWSDHGLFDFPAEQL